MAIITAEAFRNLGSLIATKVDNRPLEERTFIAFYGTSPDIISECWAFVSVHVEGCKPKHLLWACAFMKLYLPEDVLCVMMDTSKPTFRKWVWAIIEGLCLMSISVVSLYFLLISCGTEGCTT